MKNWLDKRRMRQEHNGKKTVYFIMLGIMMIFGIVFLNSFYWPYQEISKRKIFIWLIAGFGVAVVPVLFVKLDILYNFVEKKIQYTRDNLVKMIKNKKRMALWICVWIIGLTVAYIVTHITSAYIFRTPFNVRMFYTCVAIVCLGVMFFVWRKRDTRKVENMFVIVALIMGGFCISVTPNRVGVAPDDEIHYARTLELSNCMNSVMFNADAKNIGEYAENIYAHAGFDRETDQNFEEELNSLYSTRQTYYHDFINYDIWSVAYVPSAIGIILGRGLGLDYTGVFNMGRLFNLLMYVTLVYFAVRKMKYGKVLIAAIGLIPGTIFLASSYSYDPWITGFTILGFAYFFEELREDTPLKYRNIIVMIAAIAVGSLPKAIYFVLLFPLLFMPKRKFEDAKQRKIFYAMVIGASLFLMATFVMPMIIGGPGTGDARGGADVNATEQVKFILNNPLKYAKILVGFLVTQFVTLGNVSKTLQSYAYVGEGIFGDALCVLLIWIAIFDNDKNEKKIRVIKCMTLMGNIAVIVLATTALYIDFTAVKANTVAGMQGRYMIPVLYPTLWTLGMSGSGFEICKKAIECLPMLIIAIMFICNMAGLCVINY